MDRRRQLQVVRSGGRTRIRLVGHWEGAELEGLLESACLAGALDKLQQQLVAEARNAGRSWTQIGESLGVSKQSAWERFSAQSDE